MAVFVDSLNMATLYTILHWTEGDTLISIVYVVKSLMVATSSLIYIDIDSGLMLISRLGANGSIDCREAVFS